MTNTNRNTIGQDGMATGMGPRRIASRRTGRGYVNECTEALSKALGRDIAMVLFESDESDGRCSELLFVDGDNNVCAGLWLDGDSEAVELRHSDYAFDHHLIGTVSPIAWHYTGCVFVDGGDGSLIGRGSTQTRTDNSEQYEGEFA